jgi:hypothetical protein
MSTEVLRASLSPAAGEQLDLLAPQHTAVPYPLKRLWGLDSSVDGSGWWAWRCTCGRDVGAEKRCAYSGEASALEMAWHHMHDREPWAHPLSGQPPMPGGGR